MQHVWGSEEVYTGFW